MRSLLIVLFILCSIRPVLIGQVDNTVTLEYKWKGFLELTIKNEGADTLYLFDSYLSDPLRENRYLKRFDLREDKYKLSYAPFSEYLHLVKSDRLILGQDKILTPFQVKWSFLPIPPYTNQVLSFKKSLITTVNDPMFLSFDTRKLIDKGNLKTIPSDEMTIDTLHLELAFFSPIDVDNLTLKENKTYDENEFEVARRTFFVKSVPIAITSSRAKN